MSVWTHIHGSLKIRAYDMESVFAQDNHPLRRIRQTKVPFGTEGPLRIGADISETNGLILLTVSGDLRDVGFKRDMSKDSLTSSFSELDRWIKDLPKTIPNEGYLDSLIFRVETDDNPDYAWAYYNLRHPDLMTPDEVISQKIPNLRVLRERWI